MAQLIARGPVAQWPASRPPWNPRGIGLEGRAAQGEDGEEEASNGDKDQSISRAIGGLGFTKPRAAKHKTAWQRQKA
eukprot:8768270-Pyramimonas_sp.AAC.1